MYEQLLENKKYFMNITDKAMVSLKKNSAEGRLRVGMSHGTNQYWLADETGLVVRYLSKKNAKDMKLARQLAQQDYDRKVLAYTQSALKEIERLERFFSKDAEKVGKSAMDYEPDLSMAREAVLSITPKCPARRALICPHELTTEEFVIQWYKAHGVVIPGEGHSGRRFPEKPVFTNRGEAVRSKSEKIIADRLDAFHIPYIYEYPFKVSNTLTIYPDFLLLNTRTRQEFILEHFGLMGDPEYASGVVRKVNTYTKAGLFSGRKFLFTMENNESPLSTEILDEVLKKCVNRGIISP